MSTTRSQSATIAPSKRKAQKKTASQSTVKRADRSSAGASPRRDTNRVEANAHSTTREPHIDRDSLWMSELVRLFIPNPDKFATDIVFDTTCDLIREGTLQQGDRVPSYQDLSNQLQVDTFSINLAYGRLQKEGILRAKPRSGSFVASVAAVDQLAARTAFSQAIQDCRKRGMSRAEIAAILTAQMKRHFDESRRPDDERRPRTRKKAE